MIWTDMSPITISRLLQEVFPTCLMQTEKFDNLHTFDQNHKYFMNIVLSNVNNVLYDWYVVIPISAFFLYSHRFCNRFLKVRSLLTIYNFYSVMYLHTC